MAEFEGNSVLYRITGPQSIERLDPLLKKLDLNWINADTLPSLGDRQLRFVWETTCEKSLKDKHKEAFIINKLNNTQIIESKSSFAFLQLTMDRKFLDCYVAANAAEVRAWANKHWFHESPTTTSDADWWAVKASNGNGGKDIWIVNKETFNSALNELPSKDEYVIQRYVHRPLLYKGKKFHFRCYSILNADMSALVYQKAFILTAGLDFSYEDTDLKRHVTNLSVNKHFKGHPGQVPCNLLESYPEIYVKIKDIWRSVATAAALFMQSQSSLNHFEFFGMDIIADEAGDCWLIEANRLPGLESSNNNKEEEDVFYNEMMLSVLRIVTIPLIVPGVDNSYVEREGVSVSELNSRFSTSMGGWEYVKEPSPTAATDCHAQAETFKNLFRWKAYTKKNRGSVLVKLD